MRRDQDSINPRTRSDIILLNSDEDSDHPYLYARVIGIFHAQVRDLKYSRDWKRKEFLLVRWYDVVDAASGGFKAKRLYRVCFMPGDDPWTFDFVNPKHVVRAAHLIPRFCLGRTKKLLPKSIARRPDEKDKDFKEYCVNM
jgi:hypothetical protein